jgi:hypothetical protein
MLPLFRAVATPLFVDKRGRYRVPYSCHTHRFWLLFISVLRIWNAWIRIKLKGKKPDPHQSDELDRDPQQSDKLDPKPNPHQFADDKPKCMEYEPI